MGSVVFNYADIKNLPLRNKRLVKEFIKELFRIEGKKLKSVTYIFCTDSYLLEINKSFLNHNFYTDIITFNLSEGEEIIGEIYISTERIKENAKGYNVTYVNEILRVIFHGALHLCGYKDKKKSEITIMRQKEDYYLSLIKQNFSLCFT